MSIFSVVIAMLSVQLGASLAKGLFPLIGPLPTTTLRISLAAFMLVLIWRPWRQAIDRRSLKTMALYGISLGFMNLSFYLALTRIPLGICVALEFTGPLAVALFSSRKKLDFLWAVMAGIGIVLILPLQASGTSLDPWGIFLALVAGACWACYIVFGMRLGNLVHGGVGTSIGMSIAALSTLPFCVGQIQWQELTPPVLGIAFAVAMLSSAIPYSIEMFAMKKIPRKTFGILMSLEPAVAALSGFILLHEQLSLTQILAIVCVIGASAGSAIS